MSYPIKKVAVFGAFGNFGAPITSALTQAGFAVTAITRAESAPRAPAPPGVDVVRTSPGAGYGDAAELRRLLAGHDAAVCALGPGAAAAQAGIAEAAEAAGVRRLVADDFGWGPGFRAMPELAGVGAARQAGFDRAAELAAANEGFSWTRVAIGNPIDWALKRFPAMGFDIPNRTATIYDGGTEEFTGTTLEGIGRAVAGVLERPGETANRCVRVRSVKTCQRELLAAFRSATAGQEEEEWAVHREAVAAVLERGRAKLRDGLPGWPLDIVVAQLYQEGEARCVVAASRAESDNDLLGVQDESVEEIVAKAMASS